MFAAAAAARLTAVAPQIPVIFKLRKLADAGDVSAAKNVDTGRKRLHYGTVRQPYFPPSDLSPHWFPRRKTVGLMGRPGRRSA